MGVLMKKGKRGLRFWWGRSWLWGRAWLSVGSFLVDWVY